MEQPAEFDPKIPTRVALVCPRAFARAGLCRILDGEGFQVVWQGEDGSGLVAGLEGCSPDLILLGWKACGVDASFIESLISSGIEAPIVVITTPDNQNELSGALEAGAVGCLSCNLDAHDFLTALGMLADGDIVVSRDLVPAVTGAGNPERPENQLTSREL